MLNQVNDTGGTGNRNTCVEVPSFKDDSNSGCWKQNEKTSNVFQNILGQFAFVKCNGVVITPDDLPVEFKNNRTLRAGCRGSKKLDMFSVKSTLEKTGGNKAETSRHLGVGRATLYRFLDDHPVLQKSICV